MSTGRQRAHQRESLPDSASTLMPLDVYSAERALRSLNGIGADGVSAPLITNCSVWEWFIASTLADLSRSTDLSRALIVSTVTSTSVGRVSGRNEPLLGASPDWADRIATVLLPLVTSRTDEPAREGEELLLAHEDAVRVHSHHMASEFNRLNYAEAMTAVQAAARLSRVIRARLGELSSV